jgi:hypothetical protein
VICIIKISQKRHPHALELRLCDYSVMNVFEDFT